MIRYALHLKTAGVRFQGVDDLTLGQVQVLKTT